jgi:hypothetical protein
MRASPDLGEALRPVASDGMDDVGLPSAADWVLIESAPKGDSEDDFRIVAGSGRGDSACRIISGSAALRRVLLRLAPRQVILDFHVSFQRGLDLLRVLKKDFPGLNLLARVRLPNAAHPEPLYFAVEVGPAGVSFHRVSASDEADSTPGQRVEIA